MYASMLGTYLPQAAYRHGMRFAVALPPEAASHPELEAASARFRREMKTAALGMALALIPLYALYDWIAFQSLYFVAWLLAFVLLLVRPFRRAFRTTLALKRREGWSAPTARPGKPEEEDEWWANGFTYHNPHDSAVFVAKRVGIGMTVNSASRGGKWFLGVTLGLAAAVLGLVCALLLVSELVSPKLELAEKQVRIDYPLHSASFDLGEVAELSLTDEIPRGAKLSGEATGKVLRGSFRLRELGKAQLFVYRDRPPYIRFRLDGRYVYYNEEDPARTRELYERLQGSR
ncbi:DUF5808 domain-containing protein [Paenibacillus sp. B01]|uniref:DUF5808 domain-containing protein n=1 Tax=Paenibacillus sp. B01 TaxID=2660554 RepID=UPI001E4684C5|nr:DUF5808 domain-containing protein [Paenibacillus sp. B01]